MASKLKATDPKEAAPSRPKVLVFGKPGVGKTWMALDFPSVYYIDSEAGADLAHYTKKLSAAGGAYLGPDDGANDIAFVIGQVKALATEEHRFRTLVIDSGSKLFNTAVALEAERLGDENAFGADKKPAIAQFRQLVIWLGKLDMNVIIIAHEKSEWGTNDKKQRVEIGQTFDCWEKLEYELHLTVRVFKQGKTRKGAVRKSRLTGFQDGDVFDWTYASFAERYGRDVIEFESKPVTLATQDQVSEVLRLLEVVRTDSDFTAKCFAKAGASSWSDLDSDQIEKVLALLNKKLVG